MKTFISAINHYFKLEIIVLILFLIITTISFIGELPEKNLFHSFFDLFISLPAYTAITFIALYLVFIYLVKYENSILTQRFITPFLQLVVWFCFFVLLNHFFNFQKGMESYLNTNLPASWNFKMHQMSPLKALLFILTCSGIMETRQKIFTGLLFPGTLASVVLFLFSSVIILAYISHNSIFIQSSIFQLSFPGAICFWCFSILLLRKSKSFFLKLTRMFKLEKHYHA